MFYLRRIGLSVTLTLLAWPVAAAQISPAHESFDRINACVKQSDTTHCRAFFTTSSLPLYDRFIGYGLVECLPQDVHYIEEKKSSGHIIIRAGTEAMGAARTMRFIFTKEQAQWKLDVPESLRLSMGDDWQQKVDAAEQFYLAIRQQLGGQAGCPNFLMKKHAPPASVY